MPWRGKRRRYTPSYSHYVLCDKCGSKVKSSEVTLITDKYSGQRNLVVCRKHVDKMNPQNYVKPVKERTTVDPKLIRSEPEDTFKSNPNDDRLPSAPQQLRVVGASSAGVELRWLGPQDCGSSAIIGYAIKRATPCGAVMSTLNTNTGNTYMYYLDSSGSSSGEYGYKVAAINSFGMGEFSEEACFPASYVPPTSGYFITDDDLILTDQSGNYYI